ncbi:hypothetical protein [Gryllotalpicola koreensis]|uniref:Sporulation protein n=1 Tax=Gryllotalpicola koreensis TaxID=993086 RepID=A0ABP7ZVC6_9MICO
MSSVVERIAEQVRGFGLSTVYGEATELNGVHIVPVALSFHAFGAGEGRGNGGGAGEKVNVNVNGEGEGSGGGGISASVPFGAYVRDIRGLRFEPNVITLIAVATPFVWVVGGVLARLTRAKKKRR